MIPVRLKSGIGIEGEGIIQLGQNEVTGIFLLG